MNNIISKSIFTLTSLVALTACGQSPQMVQIPQRAAAIQMQAQQQTTAHEFMIRFNQDAHPIVLDKFLQKYSLQLVRVIPQMSTYVVRMQVTSERNLQAALAAMQNEFVVYNIEENQQMKADPVFEMGISPIIRR